MSEKKFHVNLAVLATGMMAFSGVLIETAMNVTFPTLMEDFSISTSQVQWVTTIYLLMISIVVPLSSYLIKNVSRRKLFAVSSVLFLLGVAIDAFAGGFIMLLIGRVLQGIATGIALPLMFNIILTKVPMEKRGMMIGIGNLTTS
ncbi:MFS transporter, partial [Vagococcus teuberi]